MENLHWVSFILRDNWSDRIYLSSMYEGVYSLDEAMTVIKCVENNTDTEVISVWVDIFDKNEDKTTIYHECRIDGFGNLSR